ncbi:hypothetical protein HS125_17210 [bacterium]|nr:hypothetical protein [bacterium]
MNDNSQHTSTQRSHEPLVGFVNLARALLLLGIVSFLGVAGLLLLTHPSVNFSLKQRLMRQEEEARAVREELARLTAESEKATAAEKEKRLRQWKYDLFSDVDVREDSYPIVVLRSGFKVIRLGTDHSLVGWKYELINTSPKTTYVANVTFTLQDADGFDIDSGVGEAAIPAERYGVVTGTINVDNVDVERLSDSSWAIGLKPNWKENERQTPGTRDSRLTKLAKSQMPLWVYELAKLEYMGISAKWKAIQVGLGIELPANPPDAPAGATPESDSKPGATAPVSETTAK